jgi:hypothetical protein
MHERGAGFATPYWHDLDAARFFEDHPASTIVTTAPLALYFSLGKESMSITPMNPEQLREYLKSTGGYLVVFQSMPLDMYGYPAEEFLQGLAAVAEFSDCVVYQAVP